MTAHANDAVTAWAGKELAAASFVAVGFGALDAVVEVFGELHGHIDLLFVLASSTILWASELRFENGESLLVECRFCSAV